MEVVSRQEAIVKNLKYYFTGKPCKYGHVDKRNTVTRYCHACRLIINRNNNKKNNVMKNYYKKYPLRNTLSSAKKRAKKKGIIFDLQEKDLILPNFCPCCGVELNYGGNSGNSYEAKKYSASLDRLDNTKGYTKENSFIICMTCNQLKSFATSKQLRDIANWMDKELEKDKE